MLTLTIDYVVELILPPPPSNILSVRHLSCHERKYICVFERDSFDPSEYGVCIIYSLRNGDF